MIHIKHLAQTEFRMSEALVEHLSIELITRQSFPAAFTEDRKHRPGILHYAYLTVP